jgi:myo-inositol catabolism protein IolS
VFGCWQAAWKGVDEAEVTGSVGTAIDAGITTFDTAEAYGGGHSERVLAHGLAGRRDSVVIATKVGAGNLAHDKVISACERSLTNLATDRIDLYQVHWPAGTWGTDLVPIEETMRALLELKEQGKIRAIGVSNFNAGQLEKAISLGRIDSLQPPYSLFWRHAERDLLRICSEHRITVLAYSPLAQGLLTGKFGASIDLTEGDVRKANRLFQGDDYQRVQAALSQLRPLAARLNVSLGTLALAWLLHNPIVCPIVGARNAEQTRQNAAAADVALTQEDWEQISAIGRIVTDKLNDDPVMWG